MNTFHLSHGLAHGFILLTQKLGQRSSSTIHYSLWLWGKSVLLFVLLDRNNVESPLSSNTACVE